MGKDIYCPRCNNLVRYGTPACKTCERDNESEH